MKLIAILSMYFIYFEGFIKVLQLSFDPKPNNSNSHDVQLFFQNKYH